MEQHSVQLRLLRSTQPPILDSRGVQPQIVRARHQGLRTPPASLPAAQATVQARLLSLPSLPSLAFPPFSRRRSDPPSRQSHLCQHGPQHVGRQRQPAGGVGARHPLHRAIDCQRAAVGAEAGGAKDVVAAGQLLAARTRYIVKADGAAPHLLAERLQAGGQWVEEPHCQHTLALVLRSLPRSLRASLITYLSQGNAGSAKATSHTQLVLATGCTPSLSHFLPECSCAASTPSSVLPSAPLPSSPVAPTPRKPTPGAYTWLYTLTSLTFMALLLCTLQPQGWCCRLAPLPLSPCTPVPAPPKPTPGACGWQSSA